MIDVPEKVKELFQKDGVVPKEVVIHFPNGEREDITTKDLASESVSFDESLCSQECLKFGLTEASMLQFETMGVENIIGREIECAYDVYSHTMVGKDIYVSKNTGWYPANSDNITYVDCNMLYYDPSQTGDYQLIADIRDCYIYYSKPMSYSGEGMIPGYDNTLYAGDICKYHREDGEFEKINPSEKLIEAIKSVQGGDAVYMLFKTPDGAYYGQVGWWFNPDIDGEETDIIYFGDEVMPYITYEDVYTKEGSVPLGRFTVKSCPRNHENMTRRKVTAYSSIKDGSDGYEAFKLKDRWYYENVLTIDVQDTVYADLGVIPESTYQMQERVELDYNPALNSQVMNIQTLISQESTSFKDSNR